MTFLFVDYLNCISSDFYILFIFYFFAVSQAKDYFSVFIEFQNVLYWCVHLRVFCLFVESTVLKLVLTSARISVLKLVSVFCMLWLHVGT